MRRLLYVPIIHDEADLGSLGAALAQHSAALAGERRWGIHQETVGGFWATVAAYLSSLDPTQLKIYQDGLAADGPLGRRIVEGAAEKGSKNYRLILDLLNRGAELRKTEDPVLLLQEWDNLQLLKGRPANEARRQEVDRYQALRDCLMERRDKFIAGAINATLKVGEVGLLFLGAYHNAISRLEGDIVTEPVKEPGKVMAYFTELVQGDGDDRLVELARYLTSPVGG